jgi:AcrR family transcriptional regulator
MSSRKADLTERLKEVFILRGYDGATLVHLAEGAGLSKASLYHHYPGGKPEMAGALVRHAIADLHSKAFKPICDLAPHEALIAFTAGFADYVRNGTSDCILSIFGRHLTAHDEIGPLQAEIAAQFIDWQNDLAQIFAAMGFKPKRADRAASQLLGQLYGALLQAKMHNNPKAFGRAIKHIQKDLASRRRKRL